MNFLCTLESANFIPFGGPPSFAGSMTVTNTNTSRFASVATAVPNLGTGSYTIEFWLRMTNIDRINDYNLLSYNTSAQTSGWQIFASVAGGQGIRFNPLAGLGGDVISSGNTNLVSSSWIHVAFVRNVITVSPVSANMNVYINGTRTTQNSLTSLTNFNVTSGTFSVGQGFPGDTSTATYLPYGSSITGLRISNTARYTAASFTIPTSPFVSDSNTLALFNCANSGNYLAGVGGSSGSTVMTLSSTNFQFSSLNYPTQNPTNSVSLQGSIQFNDSGGNAINSGTFSGTQVGIPFTSTNFTIEMWIKAADVTVGNQGFFGYGPSTTNYTIAIGDGSILSTQGKVSFALWNGGVPTTRFVTSTTTLVNNTWYHVAVTRDSTNNNRIVLYINGVCEARYDTAYSTSMNLNNSWCLGRRFNSATGNGVVTGSKIAGFRINNGCLYSPGVTPTIGAQIFTPSKTELNQFKTPTTSNLNYIYTMNFSNSSDLLLANGMPQALLNATPGIVSFSSDFPV